MAWDYTLDDVRQTQAYLLSEADTIRRTFRVNKPSKNNLPEAGVIAPLVTQGVNESSIATPIQSNAGINEFLELPDELTKKLKPKIKVYKTYIDDDDGKEYNYLLPMGRKRMNVNGTAELITGVIVKSAEFTRLGGNPAEIDTNIKFNLKLYAQNIHTFFNKTREEPNEPYDPASLQALQADLARQAQVHIDAIRQNAATSSALGTTASAASAATASANTPALMQAHVSSASAWHQSQLDALALAAAQIGPNGERDVAWIDLIKINPGQPLNADYDATLAVLERDVRIKVEIGYAEVDAQPTDFSVSPDEWQEWKKAIENQKEVFYLSLKGHQFDFKADGSIGLSIDFIASGEAKQLSPEADLFHDADMEATIEGYEREIEKHERELELANRNAPSGRGGGGAAEAAAERRESCFEGIEDQIEELENSIYEYRSKVKLRLLNQLYLDGSNTTNATPAEQLHSRVFERRFKPGSQTTEEAEENIKARRQTNIRYVLLNDLEVHSANNESNDTIGIRDVDLGDSEDDSDISITREIYGEDVDTGERADLFIFLGDIVESAIELLVPSDVQARQASLSAVVVTYGFNGIRRGATTAITQYKYYSPFATPSQEDRLNAALNEFGGILTGEVTYRDPNAVKTGSDITIKISDIPIALDIFRAWWIDTYVKSGKKTLPLRDFINALMKFVEREVFDETPLNFGRVEEKVNSPEFIVNTIPLLSDQFSILYPASATNNVFREVEINKVSLNRGDDDTSLNALHLTTIEVADSNPIATGDVPNIEYGDTTKGVLKKITFEREDIPGHSEARLFSDRDSVASNIALREKYNSSLELIGNTCFLPGSLFYLNPYPLDVGYTTDRESFARQLGLGGMYRVVNLTSALSFEDGSWNTKVNTKWESFGDGDNGTSAVANPPPSVLGLCIEEEIAWLERKRDANVRGRDAYARNNPGSRSANMTSAHAMLTNEVVRLDRLINNLRAIANGD